MSWLRPLGSTGLQVSALGLGTVKFGRDTGVKYPQAFTIPDDNSALRLLAEARELGINLIDTAPAYGNSEERLGSLLTGQRQHWLICSKVGEEYIDGESHFDFSPQAARRSVLRSLQRLRTDVIDIVLIHSDGSDLDILQKQGTLQALQQMKSEGLVRAVGLSSKTIAGGLLAAASCDVLMLTYNLAYRDELAVLDACAAHGTGVLIKKALASGHLADNVADPLQASMDLVLGHPASSSAIIGTLSHEHLRADVAAARRAIDG
tara:strand:- start:265240 stop:266028 length:789 start_codon:yes stop_codon:yes gene_type:complete